MRFGDLSSLPQTRAEAIEAWLSRPVGACRFCEWPDPLDSVRLIWSRFIRPGLCEFRRLGFGGRGSHIRGV